MIRSAINRLFDRFWHWLNTDDGYHDKDGNIPT